MKNSPYLLSELLYFCFQVFYFRRSRKVIIAGESEIVITSVSKTQNELLQR